MFDAELKNVLLPIIKKNLHASSVFLESGSSLELFLHILCFVSWNVRVSFSAYSLDLNYCGNESKK